MERYEGYPGWNTKYRANTKHRILKTFEVNQVSLRLVLFHVYFLNNITKPKGRSVALVRRVLDACYGRPSPRMKLQLQKQTKELQKVGPSEQQYEVALRYPHAPVDLNVSSSSKTEQSTP